MKSKPPLASEMLTDQVQEHGHIFICKLISKFNRATSDMKVASAYHAVESLIDSFADAIQPTREFIGDFISKNPYAFDGGIEIANLKLTKIVERTQSRWNELIKCFLGTK